MKEDGSEIESAFCFENFFLCRFGPNRNSLHVLTLNDSENLQIMSGLIRRATSFTGRKAIKSSGRTYTFEHLLQIVDIISSTLLDSEGDLKEKRIAMLVEPGFEYVATQWAIWQAGGVAVPLCDAHPIESLKYYVSQSESETLLISSKYVSIGEALSAAADLSVLVVEEILLGTALANLEFPRINPERMAMILYTSGTTNLPKGVVSTHRNIQSQIKTLVEAWEWSQEDIILNVLPLHHVHGIINVVSCALWSGACVQFLPKFSAKEVWRRIFNGELTVFMAVPTIYFKLIKFWESSDEIARAKMSEAASKMRLMVSGSAALPVSVLAKWKEITGHTLLERYGMTEIGMGLSNSYREERVPGHVGKPLPGVEIRLVDENENQVSEGEPGEIQVKSNSVFKEYWRNQEATQEAFVDGWFKTGDIARINDGYYRILGRNSVDIIKSGGYKLSALEIEEALRQHPEISECAVVGLPDEEWGEVVCAGIVCMNGETPPDLEDFLSNRLASYKVPRKYLSLDDLPRNTMGKVTKKEVLRLFEATTQ